MSAKVVSLMPDSAAIPVIDISNATGTQEQKTVLARKIKTACMEDGIFYVTGHGIPEETIDNVFSAMRAYFSLPLETKMKLYHKRSGNFRGYGPLLDSNIEPSNRGDLLEGFGAGWQELFPDENDEKKENSSHAKPGANVWPSEPAPFRKAYLNYYHAAVGVGRMLYRLFALALDLPETYFDDKTNDLATNMRTLHYPPQTGPVNDGIVGLGAHTDFECFTILWQEPGIQALQVLNSEMRWINATPIPGTLVVNIADLLARWTNDVFKSPVHRAINRSGVPRYSIALFFGADSQVQIEPVPSCISSEQPPKYEIISVGDYVQKRIEDMYYQTVPPP
ncbi:hypothetical protein J3A83DRAFT_4239204 [Scleroderma citrinum]